MNIIKKVAVAIKGGPGAAGIFVFNHSSKDSFGTEGGLFVQRKPTSAANLKPVFQRIVTSLLALVTTGFTLTGYDDGDTQVANSSSFVTFTLPKAAMVGPGFRTRVLTGTVPSATGTTITPNAADKFQGNGFNAKTAGQSLVNTQASAAIGDYVEVISDGVGVWYVLTKVGTWA